MTDSTTRAPSVWAPFADTVELELTDRCVPMSRSTDEGCRDWWFADEPIDLPPGTDYAFLLDGKAPALPDPRSPWQPNGVHARSRTLDHAEFGWTDAEFHAPPFDRAVVYELHVGTFTPGGTFDSTIEKLDYLVSLGVTHIELLPVAAFDGERGWGYDGVALFAPHAAYGGPEGLKRLVDAAHARGLAVLLDVVYNHVGPSGNYLPRFGPYFSDRYQVPWGDAINFDGPGSDEVRRFVVDDARMWLRDYHIDGLRLDAVHAIFDQSAVHILEDLATAVHELGAQLGRRLLVIAESDLNNPRLVRSPEVGGYGLDAQWSDDFHHALHTTLTGEDHGYYSDFGGLADLARALERGYVIAGAYSPHRDRHHGRPAEGVPATKLLGYLQNHDQVGNRAVGERMAELVPPEALKVAAAVVLLSPFVPMLFEGEEWAASTPFLYFTDHEEPLGEAIRNGRREEFRSFGWPDERFADPQSVETFERSKLRWDERGSRPHDDVLRWHRTLIDLRHRLAAISDGTYPSVRVDPAAGWLTFERPDIAVACNFAQEPVSIDVSPGLRLARSSRDGVGLVGSTITLPPMSAGVLVAEDVLPAQFTEESDHEGSTR